MATQAKKKKAPTQSEEVEEEVYLELDDRYHMEECPEMKKRGRLEYKESVATTGRYAGQRVGITRCVTCGGLEVEPLD